MISTYREHLPGSTRHFSLRADQLIFSGHRRWVGEFTQPLRLNNIDPLYSVVRTRSEIAGPGALILGGMFGFLFGFGLFHGRPEFFPYGAIINAAFAVLCIVVGLRNIRRVESYVFRLAGGVIAFDIARAGPDKERFDEFVQQVVTLIQSNQPTPHAG